MHGATLGTVTDCVRLCVLRLCALMCAMCRASVSWVCVCRTSLQHGPERRITLKHNKKSLQRLKACASYEDILPKLERCSVLANPAEWWHGSLADDPPPDYGAVLSDGQVAQETWRQLKRRMRTTGQVAPTSSCIQSLLYSRSTHTLIATML